MCQSRVDIQPVAAEIRRGIKKEEDRRKKKETTGQKYNGLPYYIVSFFLSFFYSSPNLSGRRLDVYHTLTHGVALVRI